MWPSYTLLSDAVASMYSGVCGHCGRSLGNKALKEHRRLYFHDGQWLREDHENQQDTGEQSNSSSPMNLSDPESDNSFEGTGCMDYYSDSEGMETFQSPENGI